MTPCRDANKMTACPSADRAECKVVNVLSVELSPEPVTKCRLC